MQTFLCIKNKNGDIYIYTSEVDYENLLKDDILECNNSEYNNQYSNSNSNSNDNVVLDKKRKNEKRKIYQLYNKYNVSVLLFGYYYWIIISFSCSS